MGVRDFIKGKLLKAWKLILELLKVVFKKADIILGFWIGIFSCWGIYVIGKSFFSSILSSSVSETTLADALNILLVVVGMFIAILGYGIYKIITSTLKNELLEESRHFTQAQTFKNYAYIRCRIYEERLMDAEFHEENAELYEELKRKDKAKELRKKAVQKREKGFASLQEAIKYAEKAFGCTEKLKDRKRNEILILWCQNNLAYYLAKKWEYNQNEWEYKDGSGKWKFNFEKNKEKFKEYLLEKESENKKREYAKDKKIAEKLIEGIEKKEYFKDSSFVEHFENTREVVRIIFSISL
ncbi:hypothetical protein KJ636_03605 [Patescibacteria group bacterium]|nr:hypothetical protein [Patescibacteria group bacterium]